MFLDRFSNQVTPSASPPSAQRSQSPLPPRRPANLATNLSRPHYNARSSSLSLISRANSSTGSLPGGSRAVNGSTLRQEMTPPPYVQDPLNVLERIIGTPVTREALDDTADHAIERPDTMVEDIDFSGLSLEDFANGASVRRDSIESEPRYYNAQSVEECMYVNAGSNA